MGGEGASLNTVPRVIESTGKSFFCHYTYVDNVGVLGTNPQQVLAKRTAATDALDSVGLLTHELSDALEVDEVLGIFIDGPRKLVRLSDRRYSRVRGCLQWVLHRGRLSGRELECLLGHLTFCFLIRRPLLSSFSACYRYLRWTYHKCVPMWPSVRDELQAALGLLPLCYSELDVPWHEEIFAYDACPSGMGVVSAVWDLKDVASVGAVNEKARFKLQLSVAPRRRALGVDNLPCTIDQSSAIGTGVFGTRVLA